MNHLPYILLVEDNEQDELLTLRALQKNSVRNKVCVVRDGAEALDFVHCREAYVGRDPEDFPQVILLDLKLPKVDGLEVLQGIKNHPKWKLVPVVILTTSKEDQDLVRGYSLGANSYVRKPVDFNEFSDAVKNLGVYWLILNERAPATGVPKV